MRHLMLSSGVETPLAPSNLLTSRYLGRFLAGLSARDVKLTTNFPLQCRSYPWPKPHGQTTITFAFRALWWSTANAPWVARFAPPPPANEVLT
jgi:hypothetical protein